MMVRWQRLAWGAASGALATVAMSAVMGAAQRLGWLGRMPPKIITRAAFNHVGVDRSRPAENAGATVAHFAFGAVGGGLYGALRPLRARTSPLQGVVYGTLIWLVSYAGWVPALRIMPPPQRDRPGRVPSMLAAHWVYGAVLDALLARVSRVPHRRRS